PSGSRCSASVENPTRSAKTTVTRRRSPARTVGASAGASVASSAVPQEPQKRKPGGFSAPQLGQTATSAAPHEPQNRASAGLSEEHAGHRTLSSNQTSAWGASVSRRRS